MAQTFETVVEELQSVNKSTNKLVKLTKENDGVKEMRKYENGSIGVFFKNGKFRLLKKPSFHDFDKFTFDDMVFLR